MSANPEIAATTDVGPRAPATPLAIMVVFGRVSSTSFGGASLAAIRREVVRHKQWLDDEQFLELLGLAQLSPGSNPTNLAVLIGQRLAGISGGFVALLASSLPGFVILMILGIFAMASRQAWVTGALRGCAAMAVGLTLANAIELTMRRPRVVDLTIVAAVAATVIFTHVSLALTLLVFVPVAFVLTRPKVPR